MKKQEVVEVKLNKIIYGGQALGQLEDGKKIMVWGGLPEELVKVKITKNKRNWAEGIVTEVIEASKERIEPKDQDSYLSTSPWQIMNYEFENSLKRSLIIDQFAQHAIELNLNDFTAPEDPYHYRNKVEFSFWWNNETEQLDLAFFKRGTHTKQPVNETSLALQNINKVAATIRDVLRQKNIQARDLKTLLVRCNQSEEVIAELYVKEQDVDIQISHTEIGAEGFSVHYSNPKSPASIKTKTLFTSGATKLEDKILGNVFTYSVDGFFQVTVPIYEQTLKTIKEHIDPKKPILDLYSGVGSIGLCIAPPNQNLKLIEIDERCVNEATLNAKKIKPDTEIMLSSSEDAVDHITNEQTVILDPPRAGLHQKVIDRLLKIKPAKIIYLSCNPATQARDIALLEQIYKISYAHGYNYFPRTPHIENLVILEVVS